MTEAASSTIARHITFMALGDDPEALDEDFVRLLSDLTQVREFEANDVLQSKGKPCVELLLVTEGEVYLEDRPELPEYPVWHGLDAAIAGRGFQRSLTAKTKGAALAIGKDAFLELLEDQFATATTVLSTLGARMLAMRPARAFARPEVSYGTALVDRALALRECAALANVSAETITSLARLSTAKELAPGDVLALPASTMHVLTRGKVCVALAGEPDGALSYEGLTPLNLAATFAGRLEPYEARAQTPCTLLLIDKDDVITEMRYHFSLWRAVAAAMMSEVPFFDI